MNILPIAMIGIIAAILAFDKRYEDGLIRHASLAGMVVASIIIVFSDWWADFDYDFSFEVRLLLWCFFVFFVCHAYSFIRWRLTGAGTWKREENNDNA